MGWYDRSRIREELGEAKFQPQVTVDISDKGCELCSRPADHLREVKVGVFIWVCREHSGRE